MEEQTKINWSVFDLKTSNDRITIEPGKKYEVGFHSVKQDRIEVLDKEKTIDGKVEVKKQLDVLILGVDLFEGKTVNKEFMVTSKKLAQVIGTYFEKKMLFSRVFQIEKSGTGYQTTYQLIALQDKEKSKDVEAFP